MSFQFPPDIASVAEQALRDDSELWKEYQTGGEMTARLLLNLRAAASDEEGFSEKDYWQAFLSELRDFLCTDSKKYKAEREQLEAAQATTSKFIVPTVAGAIGATLGIEQAILIPFVALAIFGAVKMGVNAWCSLDPER